MADPVIVPPPPTVTQPSHPGEAVDNSPGLEQLQRAFDRVLPEIKTRPTTPKSTTPPAETQPKPPETPQQPVAPPEKPVQQPPEIKPPDETQFPSFLEDALKLESKPVQPKTPEPDEEWPEELPQEERKSRIKGLRDAYKNLKQEMAELKKTPQRDPGEQARLQRLEAENRQMSEVLSRVGVEHSQEFQEKVMQPLTGAWNEAARIVRDSGGDPQELAKAMSLNGRAQFEALDALFDGMPESAKAEAHDALRVYRRYEEARRSAVKNAPKTLEQLRARENERQYEELTKQRKGMEGMFERALTRLRDDAKVEVFRTSADPQNKWWNDQQEALIKQGRELFLENTDMDKVALACLLAPAADAYRKLFLKSQQQLQKVQKMFKERIGSEPNLTEHGGPGSTLMPDAQLKEDLKKPFDQVFLREFHKSQASGRR